MSKSSRILVGRIKTSWTKSLEDYSAAITRWMDGKESRDEIRYDFELSAILAHQTAFDNNEVSFPPAFKASFAESYVAIVFDNRDGRGYLASSTYMQDQGWPAWQALQAESSETIVNNYITQEIPNDEIERILNEIVKERNLQSPPTSSNQNPSLDQSKSSENPDAISDQNDTNSKQSENDDDQSATSNNSNDVKDTDQSGDHVDQELENGNDSLYDQMYQKKSGNTTLVYPLVKTQQAKLSSGTLSSGEHSLLSPLVGKHHGVTMPPDLCNPYRRQESLEEVLAVRADVVKDKFPIWMMQKYYPQDWGLFPDKFPSILSNAHEVFQISERLSFNNPQKLVEVVHNDHTADFARILVDWLIKNEIEYPDKPQHGFNYLSAIPEQYEKVNTEIRREVTRAFEIKWYYGMPRPEEIAQSNITAFEDGCNNSPSFPSAGSAAAFTAAKYFMIKWNPSDDQKKEMFDAAYIWSMAHLMAGTNHAVDNLTFAPRRAEV